MTFRPWRVCALLFGSGACALVYQIAWFRELRLIFGASTASSSAVLAVFMGGLGVGGAILGKRADKAKNPLRLYANLEIGVAILAALSAPLVSLAQTLYLSAGGTTTLGMFVATLVRLVLSIVVLGPATFLMGGTLPSAARAIEQASDVGRRRVALLYGVNTFGAVVGAVAANFLLLEVFGTRLTLWMACLINLLVGLAGRMLARSGDADSAAASANDAEAEASAAASSTTSAEADIPQVAIKMPWFPPIIAAVTGGVFMLMELVWYRMLAPLLGGSSYTFGLILAVALAGIGVGGAFYARSPKRTSTLSLFALTCTLEALALIIPYAVGDHLAILTLFLRPLAKTSFGSSVLVWTVIASLAIFPAAAVSGYQFPSVIGLYGRGKAALGKDVGNAYLANTIGAIIGALAGGFGLLPLLSAPRCWLLVVILLLSTAVAAIVIDARLRKIERPRVAAAGAMAIACLLLMILPKGPTQLWRHSGIGAGRADAVALNQTLDAFRHSHPIKWEEDGLESTVALAQEGGYAFIVNGKVDGHTIGDASTQVMSGLLAALIHPNPKDSLVIGLGTGSTAGWLGQVPEMEHVDVVELEPSILRVAKDCAMVNKNVLDNPKVKIQLGDAREVLLTTPRRYDVIFSEPSNPYRAGISSLYTLEYYRSAARHLRDEHGLFVQWIQAYEVDAWTVTTALTTLRQVFPSVSVWETGGGDFLAFGALSPEPIDMDRLRKRLTQEPYATALPATWLTTSAEGVLSHFIAAPPLTDLIVEKKLGSVNTDDQNFLDFAFARSVGSKRRVDNDLALLARRMGMDHAPTRGNVDEMLVLEEQQARSTVFGLAPVDPALGPIKTVVRAGAGEPKRVLAAWRKLNRPAPRTFVENTIVARAAAQSDDPELERFLVGLTSEAQREILRAIPFAIRHQQSAAMQKLLHAFVLADNDPWTPRVDINQALELTLGLSRDVRRDPKLTWQLFDALRTPFAVDLLRVTRLTTRIHMARTLRDYEKCRSAVDDLGTPAPWDRDVLVARADCLKEVGDPRAAAAEEEAYAFLDQVALIGESIPSPNGVGAPLSPPPTPLPFLQEKAPDTDASIEDLIDASPALESIDGGINTMLDASLR